jgi:NAD(P)H-dependent FMN reductase
MTAAKDVARAPALQVLAICGSLQRKSANLTLLQTARECAAPELEVVLYDGLRALPHFDPDLEQAGAAPESVLALRTAVASSAALLIACPEYGHSLPGALKNAVDWLIGSGELERKIVAVTAATVHVERGRMGLAALCTTLGAVSAQIVGGEPIARGATFEHEIAALCRALVAKVRAQQLDDAP